MSRSSLHRPSLHRPSLHRPLLPILIRTLSLLLLLGSWTQGQPLPGWLVCDSSDDRVVRIEDLDGDGTLTAAEVSIYYDDSSPGPDLSTPNHLLPWNDGHLLCDGGTLDAILRLTDLNLDGDANDPGEVSVFYDNSASGPPLAVPSGLAVGPDGALFVSDDGAGVRAVLRLRDLNGDGDALDGGESAIFFDESGGLMPPLTDPESVAIAPGGALLVGDSANGRIVRLVDLDGDGTALGPGEASEFYNVTGAVLLGDIDAIQVDAAGQVYVVDENDGTIVRLTDLDGDGSALDPGELLIFHSPLEPASLVSDPNDAILIGPARVVVVDGALDAVVLLEDLDGDGAALGPAETRVLFADGGVSLSTPHGIAPLGATEAPPPGLQLDAIEPAIGDAAGGTELLLFGAGFSAPLSVSFGSVSVPASVIDAATLELVAPAHPPALVDVSLQSSTESAALPGAFRFQNRLLRGDVDRDGEIRIGDPISTLQLLFVAGTPEPPCLDAADADDDGEISIDDAILVLLHLFAGGAPPAAPWPSWGFDPTPEGPGCAVAIP